MDYTQLTDDELRRKVLELMGYYVEGNGAYFWLENYHKELKGDVESTEAEAWQQAPDPLTDANVYMGLVDEMWVMQPIDDCRDVVMMRDKFTGRWYMEAPNKEGMAFADDGLTLGRAVCEVFCQVKEQK